MPTTRCHDSTPVFPRSMSGDDSSEGDSAERARLSRHVRMRILTVVVTYNEASNIGRLIPAIQQQLPASSVLVVDDSSPDGTADIVRGLQARDPRIELMTRPAKRGYGSAAIAGMQYGISNG